MAQSSGRSGIATALGLRGDVIRDAPPAPNVNPAEEALKAILGNLRVLPDAARLGAGAQEALDKQLLASMERLMPGWSNASKNIMGNIDAWSRGELAPSTVDAISRYAAERSTGQGTAGSGFHFAGTARDLGRTSEDYMTRAQTSLERWTQSLNAPRFDFTKSFVPFEAQLQAQMWNEENRWNVAWLETQLKAQPSNSEQAWSQVLDYMADFGTMMLGGAAGGMGGGGGMGGAGSMSGGGGWTSSPYSQSEMSSGVYNNYAPGY